MLTTWPGPVTARYTSFMRHKERLAGVVHSDPDIMSGTPVFVGTRVPAKALFDYLEGGRTLDEFLIDFPSVKREQAVAALDLARDTLLTDAPAP